MGSLGKKGTRPAVGEPAGRAGWIDALGCGGTRADLRLCVSHLLTHVGHAGGPKGSIRRKKFLTFYFEAKNQYLSITYAVLGEPD
jgi:hypothetical protein